MEADVRRRINRFGAWSVWLYVGVIFIGFFLVAGFFPLHKPSASAEQITEIFATDSLRIRVGFLICMFGAMMWLPFGATIANYVARYEGRTGTLTVLTIMGGFATAMFTFYPPLGWMILSFRPRSPELTLLLNDGAWLSFVAAATLTYPLFIFVPAVMAFTDKSAHPVFPRWFGYFTLWFFVVVLPAELVFFFKVGVVAWNGLFAFWVPAAAFLIWLVIVTYLLDRAARSESSGTGAPHETKTLSMHGQAEGRA